MVLAFQSWHWLPKTPWLCQSMQFAPMFPKWLFNTLCLCSIINNPSNLIQFLHPFWSSPVIWELHINHSGSDAYRHCGRSQCHQRKACFEGQQVAAVSEERLGDQAVSKEIRMLPEVFVTILERTSPHGCSRSQPHCWLRENLKVQKILHLNHLNSISGPVVFGW